MKKKRAPEIIDVPAEALEGIKSRIGSGALLEEDKKIVLAILGTYSWLLHQLQSSKFTLNRLKKMFGFSTEKRSKNSKSGGSADFSKEGTSASKVLSLDELQEIAKGDPEKK
jgi:hypothetical protein